MIMLMAWKQNSAELVIFYVVSKFRDISVMQNKKITRKIPNFESGFEINIH